ncbi:MAG: M48 family metallopeptidase [Bacteroides sp.]|nr:M48 family metallopeptidase [Bacteroides sp.]
MDLEKKGIQNSLRAEMEKDALEYISKVKAYGLEFNDPYLENYIYSLIAKIAPVTIVDGRPGNVNLLILEDATLNACIYPNGTLVINTGLLSALHSEDELVAILSHEIAHFILDHSIDNVNKNKARQKRAEFWAALATGVAAVAEGVVASQNKYYVPGAATLGVAMMASTIASNVIERLGMKYNQDQEYEADNLAIQILTLLNYDKNALATALNRIEDQMLIERSNAMYFASYTHPALIERINKAGKAQKDISQQFEKEVSFAVTSTARMKYEDRRFRQALTYATQNIENQVATAEDYIIKANCILALRNDMQSNTQVIELINTAKSLDPTNINIYKAEILANLRLKDRNKASDLLNSYHSKLEEMRSQLNEIKSGVFWETTNRFINVEQEWSNRMRIKLQGM